MGHANEIKEALEGLFAAIDALDPCQCCVYSNLSSGEHPCDICSMMKTNQFKPPESS